MFMMSVYVSYVYDVDLSGLMYTTSFSFCSVSAEHAAERIVITLLNETTVR